MKPPVKLVARISLSNNTMSNAEVRDGWASVSIHACTAWVIFATAAAGEAKGKSPTSQYSTTDAYAGKRCSTIGSCSIRLKAMIRCA